MDDDRTYTNPLYAEYMADPFVLKHNGEYYAYGTAVSGTCAIPVLHSTDLVNWRRLGDALEPFDPAFNCFWAPEVAYANRTFFMYYSAGGREGEGHQLRVATARHPAGPFQDDGTILAPDDPFTIDAHPFRDEDSQWYLFYCHDFLEGERPGTGIVVDRLVDMRSLAGERAVVVRAHANWNLFKRQREWYDRVWDWYTLEGAFVRRHEGRYYCFYSGGAWKEPNYGVGCAVADHPLGPYRVETSLSGPEVLRTVPGKVVGPGHCSITVAPDNLHPYMIYHGWNSEHTARLMRMDPLIWNHTCPICAGPTTEPQPAPPLPFFRDLFTSSLDEQAWRVEGGTWRVEPGQVVQVEETEQQAALLLAGMPAETEYLLEVNLQYLSTDAGAGGFGIYACYRDSANYAELRLAGDGSEITWRRIADGAEIERRPLDCPALGHGFQPASYHQLLVERHRSRIKVWLDGVRVRTELTVTADLARVGLFTSRAAAAFAGVSLTLLEHC